MHLREYTRHDVTTTASIQNAAFLDDDFWEYIAPKRKQYPEAWHAHVVQKQHIALLNPSAYNFVCVADAADSVRLHHADGRAVEAGTVLGYARWVRQTPTLMDPNIRGRKTSLWDRLERGLRRVEASYTNYVTRNPIFSYKNLALADHAMANSQLFSRLKETSHWYLAGLAVAPEFQGKGVARMLVNWGIEECLKQIGGTGIGNEETNRWKVCTLVARPAGRWLYEKVGFRALCSRNGEVLNLGLADTGPSHAMIWDPTGAWTEESGVPSTHAEGLKDYVKWREES